MTLSLLSTIAQLGQDFSTPVLGRAVSGKIALTTNPGNRWRLESSLLYSANARDGDALVITETVGATSTDYPFTIRVQGGISAVTSLPIPSVGAAYDATPVVQGGSGQYRFTIASGSIPPGLTLNQSSGRIYGTPTSLSDFTVGISDLLTAGIVVGGVIPSSIPIPILSGVALRGFQLLASGTLGLPLAVQARTSSSGSFSDTGLSLPLTIGNGASGTGFVGRGYRISLTVGGKTYYSPEVGPTGITDIVANSAYYSVGTRIANINTAGVGALKNYTAGTDYDERMTFYSDELGANVRMSWKIPSGAGNAGQVACYMHNRDGRYTDDTAAQAFSAGVQHSSLGAITWAWNLIADSGSATNRSLLGEYFTSTSATSQATRGREFGVLPFCSAGARSYFTGSSGKLLGTYTDENTLPWSIYDTPGDGTVRYVVAITPDGSDRMSGSVRMDRYLNWLMANNIATSAQYMNGFAGGLEITMGDGGSGALTGQFLNRDFAIVAASAYTFDSDVAAFFSRFTNLPGMDVRKAVDAFVTALKTNSLYALLDDFYLPLAAGAADMRRAFKASGHDIVDRSGTASYVPNQGLTYAGAGYGGTQFNPSTAGGQFAQDSAFLGMWVEADAGTVSAFHVGNATANLGRNTSGTSIKHQLNNAGNAIAGTSPVGQLYSARRVAGASPGGTSGSVGYQVKRSGSTNAVYDGNATTTVVGTSTALTNAELEIGRAGSGTVYSSAVFSLLAYGGGMTNTQVDTFNSSAVTLRAALKAAGIAN